LPINELLRGGGSSSAAAQPNAGGQGAQGGTAK